MNYHEIKTDDELNGCGLRTVLWVSGCSLACPHCFNPQTWDFNSGQEFTPDTMQELINDLRKPYIKGLTITGGNPLEPRNIKTVHSIVKRVRQTFEQTKDIWIYTGYRYKELAAMTKMEYESHKWGDNIYLYPTLTMTDVIVDGRFINEQKDANYPYAGSTNQRVIDMRKSFEGDSSTGQWLNGDCVVLYKE